MQTRDIDVSELAAPEPMQAILAQLAILPVDTVLKVKHCRQPWPLYERLLANGWLYTCEVIADEAVIIYIAHEKSKLRFDNFIAAKNDVG